MIPFEYVEDDATRRNFELIGRLLSVVSQVPLFIGSGSPNTVVTASPPAMYFNLAGGAGTTWYAKESGASTNTGWVGK